jgi:tetratricopeptide (TPR) repeat protein
VSRRHLILADMIARRALSLASLAVILAIAVSGLTKAASHREPFLVKKNFDAPGYDYRRVDGTSLRDCRSLCAVESACGAFTYNIKKQVCFLKNNSQVRLVRFKGAITGIKTAEHLAGSQESSGTVGSKEHTATMAPAHAAQYVVDGFVLGAQVDRASRNYLSYMCKPSDEFADAVTCNKERSSASGKAHISSTLVHAKDGTALYAMVNIAPVKLDKSALKSEIDDLSKVIDATPTKIMWVPENSGGLTSVIAIWGPITLEQLNGDPLYSVQEGENPHVGILIDTLGDPTLSATSFLPVYRLIGGPGYVYSASFGSDGKGHRHYVAVSPSELAVRQFQISLRTLLKKDASLASDDYSLWPDVALLTRNLSRDSSPDTANQALDKVFAELKSSKLRSHVWSIVPLGTRERLMANKYWRHDTYGPKTKYPKVRSDVKILLSKEPTEPFIEFAYFVVGDFDGALKANPNSIISDVLHYASGHRIVQSLAEEALAFAKAHVTSKTPSLARADLQSLLEENPDDPDESYGGHVNRSLRFINQNPDIFDHKPLIDILPNFAARAAEARHHFELVLKHPSSPHADDSAYMIGWLELQQGDSTNALAFFSQALDVGNGQGGRDEDEWEYIDYTPAALKEVVRILERVSPQQQLSTVETDKAFDREPALWYVAARSAYRDFDYALAIEIVERALKAINIPIETLPVTTNPNRISAALSKIDPELIWDPNLVELPYLIEASKELARYEDTLHELGEVPSDAFAKKARTVITKYSELVDRPVDSSGSNAPQTVAHKDFRQALHLIDITRNEVPKEPAFSQLREWLYYRKVRILAVYAPKRVPEAISEMQKEFPTSKLLNDALAEQIFAQGIMLGDVEAAQKTFAELLAKYPNGNSVDNAYSWMAIILRCDGRVEEAAAINKEIILRFPLTRHAKYALKRITDPDRWIGSESGCGFLLAIPKTLKGHR